MAILTSKGAKAPHQLKGRRNVRITRDRRGSGSDFVGVSYDSENKKIQQTIGGETSDVVTVATLKDAMNLPADVVDVVQDKNMKAVSSNAVNSALSNYINDNYCKNITTRNEVTREIIFPLLKKSWFCGQVYCNLNNHGNIVFYIDVQDSSTIIKKDVIGDSSNITCIIDTNKSIFKMTCDGDKSFKSVTFIHS